MITINEYESKKGPRVQLLGTKDELVSLGLDEDELVNHKGDRWHVRGDPREMKPYVASAKEVNAEEVRRLRSMTMLQLTSYPDAELFFNTVANSTIGARFRKGWPGVSSLPVRWTDLAGMMMRDGWIDIEKKMLTEIGVQEAIKCRNHMEQMQVNFGMKKRKR